jgi:hypothetical protein
MSKQDPITITYNGKTQTIRKWSAELNLSESTIRIRLRKNLQPGEVLAPVDGLSTGPCHPKAITYNGKTQTIREWSAELNLSPTTIYRRLLTSSTDPLLPINPHYKLQKIECYGKIRTIAELAAIVGISRDSFRKRLKHVSVEKALSPDYVKSRHKSKNTKRYTVNGVTMTLSEWAKKLKRSRQAIYARIQKYPIEIALGSSAVPKRFIKRRIAEMKETNKQKYQFNGQLLTLKELSTVCDITDEIIENYICKLGETVALERLMQITSNHLFTYRGEAHTIDEWAAKRNCSIRSMRFRLMRNIPEVALLCPGKIKEGTKEDIFVYNGISLTLDQWVKRITIIEVQHNLRTCVRYEFDGVLSPIATIARKLGANYKDLYNMLQCK